MSSQTLSNTQIAQLRQMLEEHGSEAVFFGLGEIAKQERLKEEGHPGKSTKETKKQTKAQIRKNKKMLRIAKAEELAEKIKSTHAIDVDPTEFTLDALVKMLRTGEMQTKRSKRGKSGYMLFLAQERVENKKRDEPIPGNELVKLVGQKWREMTDEQKDAWKSVEPTEENSNVINAPEEVKETPEEAKPTPEEVTNVSKKIKETPEEVKETPKEVTNVSKKIKKTPKAQKMKKGELKIYLTEKYGWDAKLLCKFTVSELRLAKETGALPLDAMEKRKIRKKTKKSKKIKEAKVTGPKPEPEPEAVAVTTNENHPTTFELSESDDDSDDGGWNSD